MKIKKRNTTINKKQAFLWHNTVMPLQLFWTFISEHYESMREKGRNCYRKLS